MLSSSSPSSSSVSAGGGGSAAAAMANGSITATTSSGSTLMGIAKLSQPHDPPVTYASFCILECFGPIVQLVADALQTRGGEGSTFHELLDYLDSKLPASSIASEHRTVDRLAMLDQNEIPITLVEDEDDDQNDDRGPRRRYGGVRPPTGTCTPSNVRAALLCLIQHNIVTVSVRKSTTTSKRKKSKSSKTNKTFYYRYDTNRGRYLNRYCRFVNYMSSELKLPNAEQTTFIVKYLLLQGRCTTVDLILMVSQLLFTKEEEDDDDDGEDNEDDGNDDGTKNKKRKADGGNDNKKNGPSEEQYNEVLLSLKRLVEKCFLEVVPSIGSAAHDAAEKDDDGDDDEEFEFDEPPQPDEVSSAIYMDQLRKSKKRKVQMNGGTNIVAQLVGSTSSGHVVDDNRAVVMKLLMTLKNGDDDGDDDETSTLLQHDTVWRVNIHKFHQEFRRSYLGTIIARRYSRQIPSAHYLVMAALRHVASKDEEKRKEQQQQSEEEQNPITLSQPGVSQSYPFLPADLERYIPKNVKDNMAKTKAGVLREIESKLMSLSSTIIKNPRVFQKETDFVPMRYSLKIENILEYAREEHQQKFIKDKFSDKAARVCSILKDHGMLEDEQIASKAMMPVKDTRVVLYELWRHGYIQMRNMMPPGKQYSVSTMIFLWEYDKKRIFKRIANDTCTALLNLRSRRRNEVSRGAQFMDRASAEFQMDENEHEADEAARRDFEAGLDRLDNAIIELDERSMIFHDFDF